MLTLSQKKYLIQMGAKAPSGGNMQPWRIDFDKNIMVLKIDPIRNSGILDVKNYASIMALGSFYENVHQAALNIGYTTKIDKDLKKELNPIFKISFKECKYNNNKNTLVKQIDERATNRNVFDDKILSHSKIEKIKKHVAVFKNINLKTVSDPNKKALLGKILGEGDRIRMSNKLQFTQMISELRWSMQEGDLSLTGIDVQALKMPGNMSKIMQLLAKNPNFVTKLNEEIFENNALFFIKASSHIGCIVYDGELNANSFFETGQALERMWLLCTKYNIKIHPWSVLSFFFLRNKILKGEGFSQKEKNDLYSLEKDFRDIFNLNKNESPIFIFRMFSSKTEDKKSLRLDTSSISTSG